MTLEGSLPLKKIGLSIILWLFVPLTGYSEGSFDFAFLGKAEESAVGTSSVE